MSCAGYSLRRPGWPKFIGIPVELRERRALAAGSQFEAPDFVTSFCRELFRSLWLAGYCDLVKSP